MLSSSFAENGSTLLPGERKLYTIVVEEADFVTVYWLLKYVYALSGDTCCHSIYYVDYAYALPGQGCLHLHRNGA